MVRYSRAIVFISAVDHAPSNYHLSIYQQIIKTPVDIDKVYSELKLSFCKIHNISQEIIGVDI